MKFDSDFSGRIIQVTEALDFGDAVSNQVIALDGLFKKLGFNSSIFSKWHHDKVAKFRQDLEEIRAGEGDVVILHFYGFSEYAVPAVLKSYSTRVMVYHNITPEKYFENNPSLYAFCKRGREQLKEITGKFHQFWGDSQYNLEELIELGVSRQQCHLVPISVPVPPARNIQSERLEGAWLFVGRVAPNKRQLDLIQLFDTARKIRPESAQHLYLIGSYASDDEYVGSIREYIYSKGLSEFVTLTGKVSDEERETYYRRCWIFVSLSDHEGFGVPLIEASLRGLPVVALNTSAVGETLGEQHGLAKDMDELLNLVIAVACSENIAKSLLASQLENAIRFSPTAVEANLRDALHSILPRRREFKTVSIVICTYNRKAYMERVLEYLRFQTMQVFEVVVVDGPSDDGTKELLAEYKEKIKIAHNLERNLSKSRNIGIELADGDIVAFIDDDAIPFDDWVETILFEYNRHPLTVVGLGGPCFYAGTLRFQVEDIAFNRMADTISNVHASQIGRDGWYRTLLGTNATFSRRALMDCDGFDEQYDYFLDESDICWRLQSKNRLLGYCERLYLRHEFAESSNRKSKYNYNWFAICKNTAYFVAAYSGLDKNNLPKYLRNRFSKERIAPLDEAKRTGDLGQTEYDIHVKRIWDGLKQGLSDFDEFPRTRKLVKKAGIFHHYSSFGTRLRVGHEVKRLHVCILSKEFPPFAARGGIGTLYYHLASELLLMGHSVTVIVPADSPSEFVQGRFRVIYAPKRDAAIDGLDPGFRNNISWSVSALASFKKLTDQHPVDVVDTALWDTEALAISLLPKKFRPPVVLRLVTPFPIAVQTNGWNVSSSIFAFFREAERTLIDHVDALVPISDSIRNTIQNEYQVCNDVRWNKISCGIAYWPSFDVNLGYSTFQGFENVPEEVLKSDKLIVFFGRLEQRKGIDILFEAAKEFLIADKEAVLIVAGRDVEGWGARIPSVLDKELLQRVHLLGEVADSTRDKLLSRAFCVVFPSRYESFGLVPLEAFVHGVPVVASRSGAIPEVVVDGDCGLLFEQDNAKSLADCVVKLLADGLLRERLSFGARHRVKTLSGRNMALESIELYSSLLN